MSLLQKPLVAGLLGFAIGGPVWGITGYVINDLTSKVDPVVAAEIKKAEETQKSLDDPKPLVRACLPRARAHHHHPGNPSQPPRVWQGWRELP